MTSEQSTIYVGIDVSKDKLAVAIAGGERRDDVLSLGTFENTPASVSKLLVDFHPELSRVFHREVSHL